MRVTVENCGPDAADIHVMPHLWARNVWSWEEGAPRPLLRLDEGDTVRATHPDLPPMRLDAYQGAEWLFCENETNSRRLFGTQAAGHFKDAINDYVVHGDGAAPNPMREGTKCAALSRLSLAPGGTALLLLRFALEADGAPRSAAECAAILATRRAEADAFYAALQREIADPDASGGAAPGARRDDVVEAISTGSTSSAGWPATRRSQNPRTSG